MPACGLHVREGGVHLSMCVWPDRCSVPFHPSVCLPAYLCICLSVCLCVCVSPVFSGVNVYMWPCVCVWVGLFMVRRERLAVDDLLFSARTYFLAIDTYGVRSRSRVVHIRWGTPADGEWIHVCSLPAHLSFSLSLSLSLCVCVCTSAGARFYVSREGSRAPADIHGTHESTRSSITWYLPTLLLPSFIPALCKVNLYLSVSGGSRAFLSVFLSFFLSCAILKIYHRMWCGVVWCGVREDVCVVCDVLAHIWDGLG